MWFMILDLFARIKQWNKCKPTTDWVPRRWLENKCVCKYTAWIRLKNPHFLRKIMMIWLGCNRWWSDLAAIYVPAWWKCASINNPFLHPGEKIWAHVRTGIYLGLTSSILNVPKHRVTPKLPTECSDSTSPGCGFPAAAFPAQRWTVPPFELKLSGTGTCFTAAWIYRDLHRGHPWQGTLPVIFDGSTHAAHNHCHYASRFHELQLLPGQPVSNSLRFAKALASHSPKKRDHEENTNTECVRVACMLWKMPTPTICPFDKNRGAGDWCTIYHHYHYLLL